MKQFLHFQKSIAATAKGFMPFITDIARIKHHLISAFILLSFSSASIFAQTGNDCISAISIPSGSNSCVNNNVLAGTEMWFSVVPDSSELMIKLHNTSLQGHIHELYFYEGTCNTLTLRANSGLVNTNDSVIILHARILIPGNTYFIKVARSASICQKCVDNAYFDICIESASLFPTGHTVSLCANGQVQTWGNNYHGQLGTGNFNNSNVPVTIPGLTGVVAVATGFTHSLALLNDGTVKAWGSNWAGEVGNGIFGPPVPSPATVLNLCGVIAISAGDGHSMALLDNGTVMCWGQGYWGELGNGFFTSSNIPVPVSNLSGVKAIAAGDFHSIALLNNGTVENWGHGVFGELGNGLNVNSNIPVTVIGLSNVKAIDGGAGFSAALLNNGTVKTWGLNGDGQLGIGTFINSNVIQSPVIPGAVLDIACGISTSIALLNGGITYVWGNNGSGQLGICTPNLSAIPISGPVLPGAVDIISPPYQAHSWAILNNGTMLMWGPNQSGQLGNGTGAPGFYSCVPDFPVNPCPVTVATQPNFTISLTVNDAVICAGQSATLTATGLPLGGNYSWSNGSSGPTITVSPNVTTSYTVTYTATCQSLSPNSTTATATATVTVNTAPTNIGIVASATDICIGQSVTLTAFSDAMDLFWSPGGGSNPQITVSPATTTTYTVTGSSPPCPLVVTASITINVYPFPAAPVITGFANACNGLTTYTLSNCDPALTYTWNVTGGTLQSQSSCSADIQWTSTGGAITVTASNIACSTTGTPFTVAPCCIVPGATILLNNTDVLSYFTGAPPYEFNTAGDIIVINGDFTVNADLLFDNAQQVYLAPDARVIIEPGFALTITGVTIFQAGCGTMWDGIYIEDNTARLELNKAYLKEAKNAVVSKAGGDFLLTGSYLRQNFKHVVVMPFSGNHTGIIEFCELSCPGGNSLISPHIGKRTRIGVEVINVSNIFIGKVNIGFNTFDNMDFGITALESNITIKNNSFENITSLPPPPAGTINTMKDGPCPVGTSICVTGGASNLTNYSGTVGGFIAGEENTIQNGGKGIVLHRNMNGNIIKNTINNLTNTGIYVEQCDLNKVLVIHENIINDAPVGIYAYRNAFSSVTIFANTINLLNKPYGLGIIAQEVTTAQQTAYVISRNDIKNARKGIETANLFKPEVNFNKIKVAPPGSNTYADGINMANAYIPVVTNNAVNSTSTHWRINGIRVDMSYNSFISCNTITTTGQALFCGGSMPFTTLKNNSFTNSRVGFFLNWGFVGPQGAVGAPNDNRWFGNFSDAHTYSYFSIGSSSPFYVRNQSGPYKPVPMFNNSNNGFPIPINPTTFKHSLACPKNAVIIDPEPPKKTALKIIRDSVDYPGYIPENKWISKMGVYKLLQEDTTLIGQEQDLLLFNDSASLANMGTLDNIRETISDPVLMDQPAIVQQIKADNDALVPVNPVEAFQKEVNDIFLVERLSGLDSLTQQQIDDLRVIANKCPYFDGVAVYMARVLLAVVDSIGTDYLNVCEYEGLFPENRSLSTNEGESEAGTNISMAIDLKETTLKLYPNPAKEELTLEYHLSEREKGYIEIVGLIGNKTIRYELNSDSDRLEIPTAKLDAGIYLYKIIINNEPVKADKLVIIK